MMTTGRREEYTQKGRRREEVVEGEEGEKKNQPLLRERKRTLNQNTTLTEEQTRVSRQATQVKDETTIQWNE
jgi:hypothetical protein